ncbi:MAG: regulatory protein RecX [Bacteroidota bacterium]
MNPSFRKTYTPQQAMLKAASYCAYQERCYKEVEDKLAEWGIYGTDAGEILIKLSDQNYLNEERFAKAFAGGKFRVKKWGRSKIRQELKQRKVSEYCIKKGLLEIDDDVYIETLKKVAQEKWDATKQSNIIAKRYKVYQYLANRGFESELIQPLLNQFK